MSRSQQRGQNHVYTPRCGLNNDDSALLHLAHRAEPMKLSTTKTEHVRGILLTLMSSTLYSRIRLSASLIWLSVSVSERRMLRDDANLRKLAGSFGSRQYPFLLCISRPFIITDVCPGKAASSSTSDPWSPGCSSLSVSIV